MPDKGTAPKNFLTRTLFSSMVPFFILAHCVHHLVNALPVPMLPMIRNEFSLDYTRSGFVVSAFQISYGFAQLPSGWLADRLGARLVMTVGIVGVAVAGLLVGLSSSYLMLLGALVLMGVLGGGYHPASAPVIINTVAPRNRGRALGLHMIGGSFSFFLAPIIAATIATVWGWRGPFIVMAVPTLIFGIVFYLILLRRGERRHHDAPGFMAPPAPATLQRHQVRHLVSFFILAMFANFVFFSVVSFVPLYLVDHFQVSQEVAAATISFFYSSGIWAAPLAGYLSDRWGRAPVLLTACFLTGPAIYLLNFVPYGVGTATLLIAMGMLTYSCTTSAQAYIVEHLPERRRATVLGLFFFGNIEGSGLITPLLGYGIDHLGFFYSFSIAAAIMLAVTTFCAILLRD
ncbi:MAG: MFS transporter [Chloroflexota bacterium]